MALVGWGGRGWKGFARKGGKGEEGSLQSVFIVLNIPQSIIQQKNNRRYLVFGG